MVRIPIRQQKLEKFFLANIKAFTKALNAIRKKEKKKTKKRVRGGSKISDAATALGSFAKLSYLKHYGNRDEYERQRPDLKNNMREPYKTTLNLKKYHEDKRKWAARQNKYFD